MRPTDLVSLGVRRAALLLRFSRSPLAGSGLRVRRLPRDSVMGGDIGAALELSVSDWSMFKDVLFATFQVESKAGQPAVARALALFSSCAVEFPVASTGETNVAMPVPATHLGADVGLAFELSDGTMLVERQPGVLALIGDPAGPLVARFSAELAARGTGHFLEIGSRARSGTDYRDLVPTGWDYTGVDVKPGPNVDVVADAHELAAALDGRRFDAAFSVSVFEHLLMPWKVALELNRVLEVGAPVLISTHQAYPLHDEPWDFWRFSDRAWAAIFNAATGFEIVETVLSEPATVVAAATHTSTWNLTPKRAFLITAVLARKVGDASVEWPVDAGTLTPTEYTK
jgi:hypothetical protein